MAHKLALYIWEGNPVRIALALRRRGFDVRHEGRHVIFQQPVRVRDIERALRRYMLNAGRTISYQFIRL